MITPGFTQCMRAAVTLKVNSVAPSFDQVVDAGDLWPLLSRRNLIVCNYRLGYCYSKFAFIFRKIRLSGFSGLPYPQNLIFDYFSTFGILITFFLLALFCGLFD